MTVTRKSRPRSPKSAPKADLIALAAEPVASAAAAPVRKLSAAATAPDGEPFAFPFRDQGEAFREAVRESVAVSTKGVLEVNDKIIQALQIQGQAALDLWRNAIDNSRLPDGLNAQTGAAHQAFETASSQWKDVAETTARWMSKSVEPLQSAFLRQTR